LNKHHIAFVLALSFVQLTIENGREVHDVEGCSDPIFPEHAVTLSKIGVHPLLVVVGLTFSFLATKVAFVFCVRMTPRHW